MSGTAKVSTAKKLTAKGTFARDDHNRVTAVFKIGKIDNKFTATIFPGIADFESSNATLYYNSDDELTNTRRFRGTMGENDFEIKLENGVYFTGELDNPFMPATTVDGNGAWVKN